MAACIFLTIALRIRCLMAFIDEYVFSQSETALIQAIKKDRAHIEFSNVKFACSLYNSLGTLAHRFIQQNVWFIHCFFI